MKRFLLFLFLTFGCYAQTPIAETKVAPLSQTISREDLRKTIEHIRSLAREQQEELEKAVAENAKIKSELEAATRAQTNAQSSADTLQLEVNKVTDDRNAQAKAKDAAINRAAEYELKYKDAAAKLSWWRWTAGILTTFLSLGALLWVGLKTGVISLFKGF